MRVRGLKYILRCVHVMCAIKGNDLTAKSTKLGSAGALEAARHRVGDFIRSDSNRHVLMMEVEMSTGLDFTEEITT